VRRPQIGETVNVQVRVTFEIARSHRTRGGEIREKLTNVEKTGSSHPGYAEGPRPVNFGIKKITVNVRPGLAFQYLNKLKKSRRVGGISETPIPWAKERKSEERIDGGTRSGD